MTSEFKKIKSGDDTHYVLENATAGGTSSGSIASVPTDLGGVRKRSDNILAQEANKEEAPKPRNFVAKNAKMGGAGKMKDKSKVIPRKAKHKKPVAEELQDRISELKDRLAIAEGHYVKPGNPKAYDRDYAASISGMGHKDSLAYQQDGGANDEYVNEPTGGKYQAPEDKPKLLGYYFYNVQPGQEDTAAMYGVKQTKNGKWAKAKYSTSGRSYGMQKDGADKAFGPGRWWAPKTNGVAEHINDSDWDAEYDDEAGMADNNLETLRRAVDGIDELIQPGDNLPEWCQEKVAKAEQMLVGVWDYMRSEKDRGASQVAEGRDMCNVCGQTPCNCTHATDEYMSELAEMLDLKLAEKIPKGADVDYYIKDFAKSNAPQFKGKTPAKRKQMAIAAYYGSKQKK